MTEMSKLDSPQTIWRLLAELAKHQKDLGAHGRNSRAERLRKVAADRYTPIQREQLDKAKESDRFAFPRKTYLHLPPDEKGGQPVMTASFEKFDNGHMVFRIRTAILVEEDVFDNGEIKQEHRGIGIRFEGPEGPKGHNHDYAHAQWFCSFEKDTDVLHDCPKWLPDVHPAIPIPADSAVDILCCALKSFYGANSEPLRWLANMVTTRENLYALGPETRDRIKDWAKKAN